MMNKNLLKIKKLCKKTKNNEDLWKFFNDVVKKDFEKAKKNSSKMNLEKIKINRKKYNVLRKLLEKNINKYIENNDKLKLSINSLKEKANSKFENYWMEINDI